MLLPRCREAESETDNDPDSIDWKLLCYGPASSRTLPVNRRSTPQHTMAYRLRHSAITFTSHPVLFRLAMLGSSSCGDTSYPQPS
ncbi:hypothetical protein ASPFODRAFT_57295 [Aspergillus luchuensis CBS 106.47]|uniref:Uncharacterized protein n=1 Tax=Aspergillus luchuensis (strain CBS 106.47) TaxID=1137211 RepID=A0A1M3TWI1_ASPLC|nr:hypothetical protein ASPFODRAFT_57295 [Aspergillus luchuensis CBS 106.47]